MPLRPPFGSLLLSNVVRASLSFILLLVPKDYFSVDAVVSGRLPYCRGLGLALGKYITA